MIPVVDELSFGAKVIGFFKRIPTWLYAVLTVAALLGLGFYLHQREAHRQLKAADAAGYARAKAEDDAALAKLRAQVATATAHGQAISQDTRSKNDETNRTVDARAAAIGLRGPGAARCRPISDPALPAAGGEHGAGSDRPLDAAGNPVPSGDGQTELAAVPFQWLVGWGRQADLDHAEVTAWREWYVRQSAEWEKLRSGRQISTEGATSK